MSLNICHPTQTAPHLFVLIHWASLHRPEWPYRCERSMFLNSPILSSLIMYIHSHQLIWIVIHSVFLSACLLSLSLYVHLSICVLLLISFALLLFRIPSSCPSIHHQLIHYPVQLRPGPNLASRPYLCTVSCTWRLTVMQVLFFMRWLRCCLTFLAVRGALAVDFSHITCQCVILKVNMTQPL